MLTKPKDLFLIVVVVAAVAPRMPLDDNWSIGGKLSHNFRKLLLTIGVAYFVRQAVFSNSTSSWLIAHGVESTLLTVLSLLTPYLLRLWLVDHINLPGGRRPGRSLQAWVFTCAGLTVVSLCLRIATGDGNFWVFKKIADALPSSRFTGP